LKDSESRVKEFRCRVQVVGSRDQGIEVRVDIGCRVWCAAFGVQGSWFGVKG